MSPADDVEMGHKRPDRRCPGYSRRRWAGLDIIVAAAAEDPNSLTGTAAAPVADDGVVVGVPTTVLNFDRTGKIQRQIAGGALIERLGRGPALIQGSG